MSGRGGRSGELAHHPATQALRSASPPPSSSLILNLARFAGGRNCRGRWAALKEEKKREDAKQENVQETAGGAPGAPGTLVRQHVARADKGERKEQMLPSLTNY